MANLAKMSSAKTNANQDLRQEKAIKPQLNKRGASVLAFDAAFCRKPFLRREYQSVQKLGNYLMALSMERGVV